MPTYPPPTVCRQVWVQDGALSREDLGPDTCKNGGLLWDLAPRLVQVLAEHGTRNVFVLAHPKVRRRIDEQLAKVRLALGQGRIGYRVQGFRALGNVRESAPSGLGWIA